MILTSVQILVSTDEHGTLPQVWGIQPIESLLNTHTIVCDYPEYTDYPNIVAMRERCSERTSTRGGGSVVRIMLVQYIIYTTSLGIQGIQDIHSHLYGYSLGIHGG